MKLSFSLKNKEANLEADIEGIVEKGLVQKSQKPPKKTRYQIKQEEKRKNEELRQKQFLQDMFLMIGIVIVLTIICIVCSVLGFE